MSHNALFTFDLFGNTAVSSELDLGVAAFSDGFVTETTDENGSSPSSPEPAMPITVADRPQSSLGRARGSNFHFVDDRALAPDWKARARDNVAAIRLAAEIEADERPATREEQERLIRFIGFGASDLADGVFRRPGEIGFRKAGRRSVQTWRTPSMSWTTPRSPAAPSMRTSRRSSLSGRSGRVSGASGGAAAACWNLV